MVVPLEATTVKLAKSKFRTDKLKGWTRMMGAGPARQGLASTRMLHKTSHLASFGSLHVKKRYINSKN
jgi:hypothetical protein